MMRRRNLDLLIIVAGGYMDAYSYLARMEWRMVLHYLTPILLFWAGIFASMHMRHLFRKNVCRWERGTLWLEIAVFALIGFLPDTVPDVLVNSLISFCAAMQYCWFRTMEQNAAYASIFCTGNMRSCAEQLYLGLVRKDAASLKKGMGYLGILGAFFSGVLLGAQAVHWKIEEKQAA